MKKKAPKSNNKPKQPNQKVLSAEEKADELVKQTVKTLNKKVTKGWQS